MGDTGGSLTPPVGWRYLKMVVQWDGVRLTFKYTTYCADLMSVAGVTVWEPMVSVASDSMYSFPPLPGVYVFAEAFADGFNVRYVGRASSLQERIIAHLQGTGGNDCLRNVLHNCYSVKVRVTLQSSLSRQMDIEHTCYIHYRELGHSLCNASVPQGTFLWGMSVPF